MTPANETNTGTTHQRFFSLKWKTAILLSLVLVAINGSFPLLSHYNLDYQFDQKRQENKQKYIEEFQSAIKQSAQHLFQVSDLLTVATSTPKRLINNDNIGLHHAYSDYWSMMQLDLGIESLLIFDTTGQASLNWGTLSTNVPSKAFIKKINQTIKSEQPNYIVDCNQDCTLFSISPLLNAGQHVGAIILGISMADVILSFHKSTGIDVGIIILNQSLSSEIMPWHAQLVALTNNTTTTKIVETFAHQHPSIEQRTLSKQINIDKQSYDVVLNKLSGVNKQNATYSVFISDISKEIKTIKIAATQSVIAGIVGLIISATVLTILLWRPMNRLRDTAQILPLLARSDFQTVRQSIKLPKANRTWVDEIDLLSQSSYNLSYQLERLELQVEQRTQVLSKKLDELAQERDFIQHLLDTAQVIILTQDKQGRITQLNDYGQRLLGYNLEELENKTFIDLIDNNKQLSKHKSQLQETSTGQRSHAQQECTILSKDGTQRDIAWLHSHMGKSNKSNVAILSVGLDITERNATKSRLAWLATHDPLTGLANRRKLHDDLTAIINHNKRNKRHGALLLIDIDQFKYINDTSGHQSGDHLLINITNKLLEMLQDVDVLARLGGDEFALIINSADENKALKISQKVHACFDSISFVCGHRQHKISASIGIAIFPKHGPDAQSLLAGADIAMYQAKDGGRGRSHIYSPNDFSRKKLFEDVEWKQRIVQALSEERFTLAYQPIFNLHTNQISHYEVLLRMRDNDGTLLLPGTFIEVAERSGLIGAIDHFVIRAALTELSTLSKLAINISFSINLSAHAFEDPQLLPLLKEQIDKADIPASKLIFEVTETAALADITSARNLMSAIKALGCCFALDDFGVGFASFRYLKELPFDYIKIDGSFIKDLPNNHDDQILVKSLCEVATSFGKTIVAEFVEDKETMTLLRQYKVDLVQGHYIGKPAASIQHPTANTSLST